MVCLVLRSAALALAAVSAAALERGLGARGAGSGQLQLSGRQATGATACRFECFSTSDRPKLTILSLVAGLPEQYVRGLRANRALEATAYGYEYCEFDHDLSAERNVAWSKVRAIQEALAQGRHRVVWMDADAYFVKLMPFEAIPIIKHNRSVTLFSRFEPDRIHAKDILFTDDHPQGGPCGINTGVIVMRNSEWTRLFWQSVWDSFEPGSDKFGLSDQSAVCMYKDQNEDDFHVHALTIGRSLTNNVGPYHSEFIAHVSGGSDPLKYQRLLLRLQASNKAIRDRMPSGGLATDFFQAGWRTAKLQVAY